MASFPAVMMFVKLFIILYATCSSVSGEVGCPPAENITPCECFQRNLSTRLVCSRIQDESLRRVLRNSERYTYQEVHIRSSTLKYWPSDIFGKVHIDELYIQDSRLTHFFNEPTSSRSLYKVRMDNTSVSRCSSNDPLYNKPRDCADILAKNPFACSGVYKIWPRSRVLTVYCDMEDDGGAWTVIQRRGYFDSGKEYFLKDWADYKKGFGDLKEDFWIGNDNIFALTNQISNTVKFTLTDWEKNKAYATYDEFWIEDELKKYTVHVSGYKGTAGDSFSSTNGQAFTTIDQDNDKNPWGNCAVVCKGAWWYDNCHFTNLNGLYLKGAYKSAHSDGIIWEKFKGHFYSLKETVIKIRPKAFQRSKITETQN